MTGDIEQPGEKDQEKGDSSEEVTSDEVSSEQVSDEEIELSVDEDINVGSTAEINVDKLVAKIDSTDTEEAARQREIRQKVDALNEQRDDEAGSTYNFNLDDEL